MDITIPPEPFDVHAWRVRRADRARLDAPATPSAVWVAKELVYWCTWHAPDNAYHVVVRLPLGLDAAAVSPHGGRRAVRLLYEWADCIAPHLHLTPAVLTVEVLYVLASEGNRLRAGLAYAASGRDSGGQRL